MQVFVSWSGDRSRQIAEAIRAWLPKVVQSVRPWMSDEDIGAGSRWLTEVSTTLNNCTVGVICITPENQHNPWLLFEAGALSKTLEQTCVCPLVFELTPGQLTGPLTQFQANALNREGIGKVLATINKLGDRPIDHLQLDEILDVWWPKLLEKLAAIPVAPTPATIRSTNDQLEELLLLAREQLRRENLRLEAFKEREEKVDGMLGHMDKVTAVMRGMQNRLQPSIDKSLDTVPCHQSSMVIGIPPNGIGMMDDATKTIIASIGPSNIDLNSLQQLTETMRDLQEMDKEQLKSMLTPPPLE